MAKIKEVRYINNGKEWHPRQFVYFCPGCKCEHAFGLITEGGKHTFNMNFDRPTVSPSLLANFGGTSKRCHSFITNGNIKFENDSEHALAGKIITLPEINPD